jgi:hypothetical protein
MSGRSGPDAQRRRRKPTGRSTNYNCIHNKAIQRGDNCACKAIHGAYSYPDITALTQANVSQNPNCTPPILNRGDSCVKDWRAGKFPARRCLYGAGWGDVLHC